MIYVFLNDPTTKRIIFELVNEVRCFDNAVEFLEGIHKDNEPIVVIGGNMDIKKTIELIKTIRVSKKGAKIFVVTTSGQEFDRDNLIENGADFVITKPFSPKLLKEKLLQSEE